MQLAMSRIAPMIGVSAAVKSIQVFLSLGSTEDLFAIVF
jgi:hypothetical protein